MNNGCRRYNVDPIEKDIETRLTLLQTNMTTALNVINSLGCLNGSGGGVTPTPTPSTTVPVITGNVNNNICGGSQCTFTVTANNYNANTVVTASTDSGFQSNLQIATSVPSVPGSYILVMTTNVTYYIRATNDNVNYSNVITMKMFPSSVTPPPTNVPSILTPTQNQILTSTVYPYTFQWSCSGGIADNFGYAPYNKISLTPTFNSNDGVIGTYAQNAGSITVSKPGTYYIKASNDNLTWSNTVVFTVNNTGSVQPPATQTPPTLTLPVANQTFSAVSYPYTFQWSTDASGTTLQVSLKSDFSTVDGNAQSWVSSGGDITVNSPGKFYIRASLDGTTWSTPISVTVITKDISTISLLTPTLSVSPYSATTIIMTLPQLAQTPPYGVAYSNVQGQLFTDSALTNLVGDQTYTNASSTTISFAKAGVGTTYYGIARAQVDGVWAAWSQPISFTL